MLLKLSTMTTAKSLTLYEELSATKNIKGTVIKKRLIALRLSLNLVLVKKKMFMLKKI